MPFWQEFHRKAMSFSLRYMKSHIASFCHSISEVGFDHLYKMEFTMGLNCVICN